MHPFCGTLSQFLFRSRGSCAILIWAGLLFCLISTPLSGTVYYVDPICGDDLNDGSQINCQKNGNGPWKTIQKVNETSFAPGDSILFKRGGVWKGEVLQPRNGGIAGNVITITDTVLSDTLSFDLVDPNDNGCIYFGAYGDGEKPRIDCQGGRGIVLYHHYIIIEDLHLNDGGNSMVRFEGPEGNYWTILNNIDITGCSGNALSFYEGGGNVWLRSLYVYDYATNGIYLRGSKNHGLKGVLVENCWIEDPEVYEKEDAISCHDDEDANSIQGDVIIRNNTIFCSGEDGVDITSGSNILVEGNYIREGYNSGILVHYDRVSSVEVRGNFLADNVLFKGGGAELRLGASNIRVVNNIITGTGHNAVLFDNASDIQFWNNVIAPNESTGSFFVFINDGSHNIDFKNNIFDFSRTDQQIDRVSKSTLTFDNNCYFTRENAQKVFDNDTFWEARSESSVFEPNGFFADPQFVDSLRNEPDHFKLKSTSPCLDNGSEVPVWSDFWNNYRPSGNRLDIGAHEGPVILPDVETGNNTDAGTDNHPELGIFPNPFFDSLHITFGDLGNEKKKLKIIDVNGNLILEKLFDEFKQDHTFYLNDLHAGNYYLVLVERNFNTTAYPIIKQD